MSLRRVRQRLARMLAEHEEGERDGHAPTAQAHARLAAQLREDIAAIDEARAEAELLTDHAAGTLCIRCDLLQVERDDARARARQGAQTLVSIVGAEGPKNVDELAERVRDAHDEAIARAEQAEARLAALREAVRDVLAEAAVIGGRERSVLTVATGAAAAAAEAHDRRVRAEALRWEADRWSDQDDDVPRWLRARADEIEGGER